jgi:Malectin domain
MLYQYHVVEYIVQLHFAKVYFGNVKDCIFKVSVQGRVINSNLDLVAVGGCQKNTAVTITTLATVASGSNPTLKIEFENIVESALVSGIEVIPAELALTSAASTVRINAASRSSWTDPATGLVWFQDLYFRGGGQLNTSTCPTIKETEMDNLFCLEQFYKGSPNDSLGYYKIPVLPGEYVVRLYFAETFFTSSGARKFKISVPNGIAQEIDIFSSVGANTALVNVNVATIAVLSPTLRIDFSNSVDNAKINAIEVIPINVATSAFSCPVLVLITKTTKHQSQ